MTGHFHRRSRCGWDARSITGPFLPQADDLVSERPPPWWFTPSRPVEINGVEWRLYLRVWGSKVILNRNDAPYLKITSWSMVDDIR